MTCASCIISPVNLFFHLIIEPHLGNVVHDRDLELPVHEGLLWIGHLVIQHILKEDTGNTYSYVCFGDYKYDFVSVLSTHIQYIL